MFGLGTNSIFKYNIKNKQKLLSWSNVQNSYILYLSKLRGLILDLCFISKWQDKREDFRALFVNANTFGGG